MSVLKDILAALLISIEIIILGVFVSVAFLALAATICITEREK